MKITSLISIIFLFLSVSSFAQKEEVGPLMGNPQLMKNKNSFDSKINSGTFDSTFIYTLDTVTLPVFDEFSRNKFQIYNANYTDAGVTLDKKYRLLDNVTQLPLASDVQYTEQVTFTREIDVDNGTFNDVPFTPIQVKVGDLSSYPVSYATTDLYPPYYIYDTISYPNPVDTVWLTPEILQDSATQFFATINDPNLIWADAEAYHNYTFAVEPWSLGVATFDGLDEFGHPYQFGSAITNYADNLTSKPIDMSAVSASDSVYLSFLYQAQGFGDAPESGDSLILEFYAKDLDQWNRIWSTNGIPLANFKMAHLRIDNPDYFKKGFQFRFRNYGGLSGSLDQFHIDYVNLRIASGYQDTVIHDFAIVYPINNLLDTYTSVPWEHYQNNPNGKMSSTVDVVVRNSDNVPENEQDGSTEIKYNGTTEATFLLSEALLNNGDLNYSPWTTYSSVHDFSTGSRFDETKTGLKETFQIVSGVTHLNSTFTQNDSSYTEQYFQNYYSYDDGTAEAAYGPTGAQARLAIQYTPYETDSVIGARIHFVPSVYDVSGKLFLLTMWDDNNGVPGNVLYQDELFFPRQPKYAYNRDVFTNYYFKDTMKVGVTGTFYIGWKQFDADRLNVGLDRNLVNNDKTFYSVDNGVSWNMSSISGSVMINPIFSTSYDAVLGIETIESEDRSVNIYPNPTNGEISIEIDGGHFEKAEVFNLQGLKVIESTDANFSLSNLPSGMYFIRVNDTQGPFKIIKK